MFFALIDMRGFLITCIHYSILWVKTYQHIFILTGAGISAESGISTFRDRDGLWENYAIEDVATPQAYERNPHLVHEFYNQRRAQLETVTPNPAHRALAKLQKEIEARGGTLTLVTQNVDDLHERCGVNKLIHMHGELRSLLCTSCGIRWAHRGAASPTMLCPHCHLQGGPRPDIVWFGEMPYHMDVIEKALMDCDLFVSIGTSGAVYPAAGFVHAARNLAKKTLEINLEPSEGSYMFDETRYGEAGTLVPLWVEELLLP